jgi:hypothetical protein
MGAGKAWSDIVSLFATKAFVWPSENPVKGNGMKVAAFQTAILTFYERQVRDKILENPKWVHHERTGCAIMQMYEKVKTECLLLEEYICTTKAFKPTRDPNEEDFIRYASAMVYSRAKALLTSNHTCGVQMQVTLLA